MHERLLRTACQGVHGFTSITCLDPLVVPKDLCPGFLDDQHPDFHGFVIGGKLRLREGPIIPFRVVREIVVDYYGPPFSIDVHLHGVAPRFVHFMSQENFLDPVRILGDGAQRCKEVAIT